MCSYECGQYWEKDDTFGFGFCQKFFLSGQVQKLSKNCKLVRCAIVIPFLRSTYFTQEFVAHFSYFIGPWVCSKFKRYSLHERFTLRKKYIFSNVIKTTFFYYGLFKKKTHLLLKKDHYHGLLGNSPLRLLLSLFLGSYISNQSSSFVLASFATTKLSVNSSLWYILKCAHYNTIESSQWLPITLPWIISVQIGLSLFSFFQCFSFSFLFLLFSCFFLFNCLKTFFEIFQ